MAHRRAALVRDLLEFRLPDHADDDARVDRGVVPDHRDPIRPADVGLSLGLRARESLRRVPGRSLQPKLGGHREHVCLVDDHMADVLCPELRAAADLAHAARHERAFNFSAALALVCDYHRGATRSLATGIHNTGYTIGIALGGLGGMLADWRSWRFAFSMVGLAGMAYCVVIAFLLRDLPREEPKDGRAGGGRAQDPLWRGGQEPVQLQLIRPDIHQHGLLRIDLVGDAWAGCPYSFRSIST